uniref:Uncharacterized protein n=1 Tax=Glossina pallidipes TaxID=7398 RepID=A0A1A9ZCS8_GLOPL
MRTSSRVGLSYEERQVIVIGEIIQELLEAHQEKKAVNINTDLGAAGLGLSKGKTSLGIRSIRSIRKPMSGAGISMISFSISSSTSSTTSSSSSSSCSTTTTSSSTSSSSSFSSSVLSLNGGSSLPESSSSEIVVTNSTGSVLYKKA